MLKMQIKVTLSSIFVRVPLLTDGIDFSVDEFTRRIILMYEVCFRDWRCKFEDSPDFFNSI